MELAIHHITTDKRWADIVLDPATHRQLDELRDLLKTHMNTGMRTGRLSGSNTVLFHGPGGTGKSLAAALLGKETGKNVYRIDLNAVISKYIGETEKNLDVIFDTAEKTGGILFFDESDALFRKRSWAKDAHDRYANIEVSYLLQKIEAHPGLIILTTNMKSNIDKAFLRSLNTVIHFPIPAVTDRKKIWEVGLAGTTLKRESPELLTLSERYEMSPGMIINLIERVLEERSAEPLTYALLEKRIEEDAVKKLVY